MSFAALDLGTNTFRLLIAEPSPGRPPWRRLDYAQAVVRLGEGFGTQRTLAMAARMRALAALEDFAARLKAFGISPDEAWAVATAAVREAENGAAFLEEVRARTGITVRTLTGEEEARLSLAGASAALAPELVRDWLLVDVGGGSTEFVRARNQHVLAAISIPIGVVKLTERWFPALPPPQEAVARLRAALRKMLEDELGAMRAWGAPCTLVATAGTPTTLAALALGLSRYDPDRINGWHFAPSRWQEVLADVLAASKEELAAHPLVPARRADVLAAGAVLLDEVQRYWGVEGFYVSDAGLLEGAWLAAAGLVALPSASTGLRS